MRNPQSWSDNLGLQGPSRTILGLVIANVVCYVVYLLLLRAGFTTLTDVLPLVPSEFLTEFKLWQPLTGMFLHDPMAAGHLLWNCLFLWMFGGQLEMLRGSRRVLEAYFFSGLAGWAAVLLVAGVGQALGGSTLWDAPHLGASGAVMGVTACWGGVLWRQRANFLFLGSMEVRTFILIMLGVELLGALSFGSGTSWLAHLGGMAFGLALGRGILNPRTLVLRWQRRKIAAELQEIAKKKSRFGVIEGGRSRGDDHWEN